MSSFTLDDDALPTAVVAISLSGADGAGWLVARLSLEELWRTVDRIRIGEAGFALVVANDGRLLAHGNPLEKSTVASDTNLREHPLVKKAMDLKPDQSQSDVTWARYGTAPEMLGVAAFRPALGWTVIVEQPVDEAYAVPQSMQQQLGFAIAIALLAMVTVGYVWGRSFINPILTLTRGTKALAEGRLDERVVVHAKDELGQLGTAFNNMADRLVELQEDVKKQERQAMFGRVSIGLVHDLSNPIQNIGNACKMIVMMFDDLEYREIFKRTAARELAQIKRMLDDLRNIAKPVPLQKFPLDINKAIVELVESMQGSAQSSGLTLETALCFGPLYIEGDLYALNRVYGNLIKNAFQATPPQGTVAVRTHREAGHAVIEVADTGSGIPPDRLGSIFEDFVTTKRQGLGLGLAISKKIVEQLGGTITVASEVGRGTTFTVRFPVTSARPEQLAS
jgi:signal transduction histidine kinase